MSMSPSSLIELSAVQMSDAIRGRQLTVEALVTAHIRRIEAVNGALNAVIHPLFETALKDAREADRRIAAGERTGRLFGVPMTIKDEFMVRDTPTTVGLGVPVVENSETEGPLVRRLREAGAVFLGKTNLPAVCLTHECRHARFGPASNPWNTARVPGGSSGGEAAIIAAKGSPLGLGADMGGSIRIPAHMCGIHGLKPTAGRFPNDDAALPPERFGAFSGFEVYEQQPGPMARWVDDLKLAMDVLLAAPLQSDSPYPPVPWQVGPISSPDNFRIGVWTHHPYFPPSAGVERAVQDAATILREAGLSVVPFAFPAPEHAYKLTTSLISAAGSRWIRQALGTDTPTPTLKNICRSMEMPGPLRFVMTRLLRMTGQHSNAELLPLLAPLSADRFQNLIAARSAYRTSFLRALDDHNIDILIAPPYAMPAPPHNADISGAVTLGGCYSILMNLLGLPAGTAAASRVRETETETRSPSRDAILKTARDADRSSAGLPLGVQVIGRHWREDQVLSVMKLLEIAFREREGYPNFPAGKLVS